MRPFDHIGFTLPWNFGEQPAVSLCCGMSASGMPIGLQIVGPRFDDLGVLQLARFFEAHRGFDPVWPAPWGLHHPHSDPPPLSRERGQ
jgi:aspartyl-tRNA(Asn)/glutamyl-tRNA(Gln) amidotransferase subunit A